MNKIQECAPDIANITQLATLRQNVREHPHTEAIIILYFISCTSMKLSDNLAMHRFSSWKNGEMEPWYCFIDVLDVRKTLLYFTSYYVFMPRTQAPRPIYTFLLTHRKRK